jgi:hypothetical protein
MAQPYKLRRIPNYEKEEKEAERPYASPYMRTLMYMRTLFFYI